MIESLNYLRDRIESKKTLMNSTFMISSPDFSYGRRFILRVHKKNLSRRSSYSFLIKVLITGSFTIVCHLEAVSKANYKGKLYLSFHREKLA